MGNHQLCCKNDEGKAYDFNSIEEFYDPFSEIKKNIITDKNLINQHSPNNARMLNKLPTNLVKLEADFQEKYSQHL